MIGKKINQLATELAPASTDLTIIGNPTTGVSKKITLAQLGAIFSGAVSFYTNYAAFPTPGTTDVIYCAKDTKKLYLWSGSAYVEVFPSQALLDTYQLRSEKGNANGYASLDSTGKVPVSQLPSSIMEYKGTWSAATNTPTLANGTGDTGDVYICNAAGSVNFGAGAITFAVGDYVIYSGSIWQRSSGAVGTVTSVAASITGNAIGITGSPVTTSGTLALAFAGTSAQYVNGAGNLVTFPSIISQAQNIVSEVYNNTGATLTKGTIVYINGGQGNLPTVTKALATSDSTSAQTYGIVQADITNMNNGYVVVTGRLIDLDTQAYSNGTQLYLSGTTAGTWTSTKPYAPIHLVYVGIVVRSHPTQGVVDVKIQNGYELDEIHNVSAQTPTNNDGLFWEASTSLWKNKSISTILGGTPITGSGNVNAIPKFTANSVLGNSVMEDDGNFVSMRGLKLNVVAGSGSSINFGQASSISAAGLGYSSIGASGTAGFIFYIDQNTTQRSFIIDVNNINSATTRNYSMPNSSGTFALTSDIPSLTGYVPYTGATNNVNLGTYDLYARSFYVEGTASYQSGLVIKQISGFNFVTGAYTQLAPSGIYDLNVVHNQTNGTRRIYQLSVAGLQDGDNFQYLVPRKNGTFAMTSDLTGGTVTSVGLSSATSGVTIGSSPITTSGTITLAIATASGSQQGLLSSTDWTTFNNKQNALTNPVTGTGTTNYLPKFTGTSTIGNSQIFDTGSEVRIFTTSTDARNFTLGVYGVTWDNTLLEIANDVTVFNKTSADNGSLIEFRTVGGQRGDIRASTTSFTVSSRTSLILGSNNTNQVTLDTSGNLGLGVTPSAWTGTNVKAFQFGNSGALANSGTFGTILFNNSYYNSGYKYITTAATSAYVLDGSTHIWYQAPSGTAGNAISFTQAMTLDASGRLGIGVTSMTYALQVNDVAGGNMFRFASGSTVLDYYVSGGNPSFGTASNNDLRFRTNDTTRLTIASTGAATFSSSVTAGNLVSIKGIYPFVQFLNNSDVRQAYIQHDLSNLVVQSDVGALIFNVPSERMRITTAGNVGIGSTNPNLSGAASGSTVQTISATTSGRNALLELNGTRASDGDFVGYLRYFNNSAATPLAEMYALRSTTDTTGSLVLATSGSERMRINSNGNIGIGTTNSSYPLNVYKAGSNVFSTVYNVAAFNDGSAAYKGINLGYISNEQTGVIYSETGSAASNIAFWTYSGSAWGERMRIKSNGIINLSNVPSSSAGLSSGDIYKTVAGVLMIV